MGEKIKKDGDKSSKVEKEKKAFDSYQIELKDLPTAPSLGGVDSDAPILEPKKRGRPPKAEKEARQAELDAESQVQALKISEDVFTPVFNLLNKILVSRYGEVVKLDEDEIQSLKHYLSLVSAKYLPSVIQKFGAEFTLGILTFTITTDKVVKYQQYKLRKSRPKVDKEKESH